MACGIGAGALAGDAQPRLAVCERLHPHGCAQPGASASRTASSPRAGKRRLHRRRARVDAVLPREPNLGLSFRTLAPRRRSPRSHRRPPLLRAPGCRLVPPGLVDVEDRLGRPPGRLDADDATGTQLFPGGGPGAGTQTQALRSRHGAQNRTDLSQARDPRAVPEHRAVRLPGLRHRNRRTDLFQQISRRAQRRRKRHARGDVERHHALQPGA